MSQTKLKRAFKGIWIPKELWLAKDLSLQEKVFLAEIDSLDQDKNKRCYASNAYFSDFFRISVRRVSIIINSLCEKKRIKSEIDTKAGNKRKLWVLPQKQGTSISENKDTPYGRKQPDPIEGNVYTPVEGNCAIDNKITNRENKEDNNKDFSLGKLSKKLSKADAESPGARKLKNHITRLNRSKDRKPLSKAEFAKKKENLKKILATSAT